MNEVKNRKYGDYVAYIEILDDSLVYLELYKVGIKQINSI